MRTIIDRPGCRPCRAAVLGAIAIVLELGAFAGAAAPGPQPRETPLDEATVTHVLNRVAFGPSARDAARLREVGLTRYLDEQLQPDAIPDAAIESRLSSFETLALSSREISERYYVPLLQQRLAARRTPPAPSGDGMESRPRDMTPEESARARAARQQAQRVLQELGAQKLLRAVYSERQLQEVLVDFWFNHFNVFAGKGPVQTYLTEYERDAIRPHVLGSFRELLGAVAHSPAMLFYLDNWQNSDPSLVRRPGPTLARRRLAAEARDPSRPAKAGGLNENYARELLELHTLGVDAGYTQKDIVETAKAFTGWTIRGPRQGGGFWFDERRHVKGPKHVLGTRIDRGGEQDGEAVLDLLARHPATATFIATKLARRFVSDTPPAALVARAAGVFRQTHGDLRAVTRVIVTAPELRSSEARRAKVKTPFEFVVSALRASDADVTDATSLLPRVRELGMPLYFAQPPTGYADRADAWVNTGALLARMNFALALVHGRLPGVQVTAPTQLAALTLGSPEFQRR